MTLHLWEGHAAVAGSTRGRRKTAIRSARESRLRAWLTKQLLHFNKQRYLLLHSLLLLLQGQWAHLPLVSRVLLALGWCLHLTWGALPWCRGWVPLLLRWCQWDLLLEWGRLWEATCQWCPGPQWWDLLPIPWWCPPGQEWPDQTDKEIGEPLYISFILLVLHQEIMVLWLGVFSNSMIRKTCSPFLSERVVLEGSSGTEKTVFICIVKCENKIVNSFS